MWRHLLWILTIALYAFLIPRALAQVQHSQAGVTHITLTAELSGTLNLWSDPLPTYLLLSNAT